MAAKERLAITPQQAEIILKNATPFGQGGMIVEIVGLSESSEGQLYARNEDTYNGMTHEEFVAANGSPHEWMRYAEHMGRRVSNPLAMGQVNELMGGLNYKSLEGKDTRNGALASLGIQGYARHEDGSLGPKIVEVHFRKKELQNILEKAKGACMGGPC